MPGQMEVDTPHRQIAETPHEDQQPEDGMDTTPDAPSRKIALVDGMVLLQKMAAKPATVVQVQECCEACSPEC